MFENTNKTFSSLKIRNYRLYFIGQAISLVGTWMQMIAQDWLVLKLTNSGTQLGIVSAFQFLPILILGPWGGVIADRYKKRRLLFFTQLSSGLLALILGLLVIGGTVQIWMVYVLALTLGLVNVIDNPVRQTFVSEMVGKDQLANAVGLNATQVSLARAIGPMVGGGLIATVGLGVCFMINAVSYVAVLIVLFMMRESELIITPKIKRAKGQLRAGLAYVNSSPILKNTLLMMAIIGTLSYEFSISLPLLARFTFSGNAATYGFLVAATGFGSIIGGLMAASRKSISSGMVVWTALLFGITLTVAAWMPSLMLVFLALFLAGIFSVSFISMGNTTLQLESRPEMRGRVMSLWTMAFLGSTPIGGPIIGWIGEYWGPRWALSVGGLAAIFAAFYGMAKLLRKEKIIPIPEEVRIGEEESEIGSRTKI
jgi:MFS family permease